MRTSVVVVPRERFTCLVSSLRSLFATISEDVPVVVVEGRSPERTLAELRALRAQRPFELVSLPYMVKPNEARNIGIARTATEYVVLTDNDIQYEPGWLTALEAHAEARNADAVAPLICIGPPPATVVHHAGGWLRASRVEGTIRIDEEHRCMDVPLEEARGSLPPPENHVCEFHCMMARRTLLEEMGGLDERLMTREQVDFALRAQVLGATVSFAERAIVTYMARTAFSRVDLRYHLFRWADRFVVESLDAFEATWGVALDREITRYAWTAKHRLRAAESAYPRLRRMLGKGLFASRVVSFLENRVTEAELAARSSLQPAIPRALPREDVSRVLEQLLSASDPGNSP